jgi:hypothetical protein
VVIRSKTLASASSGATLDSVEQCAVADRSETLA